MLFLINLKKTGCFFEVLNSIQNLIVEESRNCCSRRGEATDEEDEEDGRGRGLSYALKRFRCK